MQKKKHLRAVTFFTGLVFIYLFLSREAFCQINILPATAEDMVANLVGPGITYSNVRYTGKLEVAAALFANASTTNLGLNSGVVITSGSAALIPENTSEFAGLDNGGPNIPELNAIANTVTSDGFILEFDFIPLSANLNVKYIFGSEEYMEWVFQGYNDAFAFFISGPGIAGEENIAKVGGQAVTINNINPLLNSQYFIDNRSSSGPNSIEYDGFTTVLTALKTVIPCSTYHIRLMVADGGDPIYDTGVFIEEGGLFTTGNRVTVAVQNTLGLPASVEGCSGGQFVFTMPAPAETNTSFYFTVGGTAVAGADYAPLPDHVTIQAGQTFAVLPVTIYDDGLSESPETLTLTVETSPCGTETFTMHITDGEPLVVNTADRTVCTGVPADLSAVARGGTGGLTYIWDNRAGTGPAVAVQPETTTVYTVTVTDQCGRADTSACTVTVTPGPTSDFSATPVVCGTDACTVTYTGTAGTGAVYAWSFDGGDAVAQGGPGHQSVTWNTPGTHTVTLSVTETGCAGAPFSREVSVAQAPPAPEISSNSPVCEGNALTFAAASGSGAAFFWTGPQGYTSNESGPVIEHAGTSRTGQYACYVVAGGCTSEVARTAVQVDAGLPAPQVTSNSPVCEGGNIELTAGTVNGAGYVWSGPGGFSSTAASLDLPSAGPAAGGIYTLYLTGSAGCVSDTVHVTVTVQPLPAAPEISSNSPVCAGASLSLSAGTGTGGGYAWTGPGGYRSTEAGPVIPDADASTAGTYTVVRTAGACTSAAAAVEVAVIPVPVPDAGPDQTVCSGQNVFIGALNQPPAEYTWSVTQGLMGANSSYTSGQWMNDGPDILTIHLVLQANNAGCTASDETVISVVPLPVASFGAPAAQCLEGNSFAFAADSGAFSPEAVFLWTFTNASVAYSDEPAPQDIHFLSTVNVDATLKVSRLGCHSQPFTRAVTVHGSPTANFKVLQPEGCAPLSVHFMNESVPGAGGPMAYEWQLGNGEHSEFAEPASMYSLPGEYTVKLRVKNSVGCTGDITKIHLVKAYHPPVAGFTASPETVYAGEPVFINHTASGNADSYIYTVSGGGQYAVPDFSLVFAEAGTYTVYQKVTAGTGCTDLSTQEITVLEKEALFVPNAFTPDGDGMNNTFRPVGSGVSGYSMGIYTRWGQLVFYTTDIETGWDGHLPGGDGEEQQDVYLYRIAYTDNSQHARTLLGTVLLVR